MWSELSDKVKFLKYAAVTCPVTQKQSFVVYAHTKEPERKSGWLKLFGAETPEKVSAFEDCELYCRLVRERTLKSFGEPLRKDVVREENDKNTRKRKVETEGRGYVQEASKERDRGEMLRHELSNLRIQRLELEQKGACHETLQVMDAAIRKLEQQLDRAQYEKWWERPPPDRVKRPCGHSDGSVLRECCKLADADCAVKVSYERPRRPVTYYNLLF